MSYLPDSTLSPQQILKLLEADGLLARLVKGFESRPQQRQMTANVIEAYNENSIALIEAGTGTGKSLAYLIPALIWAAKFKERTIISTNTINLQEQLIHKDIPKLLAVLNLDLKAALVKGMSNYLCLRKLSDVQLETRLYPSAESEEIEKISVWSQRTTDGSRTSLPFLPTFNTWEKVGAESEACSHGQCPYYQQCFFFKARRQAQEAQILVANHHMLLTDLAMRADSDNYEEMCLIPVYKRVILDEAHHLEELATEHFADRLHRLELNRILGRLASDKQGAHKGKLPLLKEKIQTCTGRLPAQELAFLLTQLSIDLPAVRHRLIEETNQAFDAFVQFIVEIKQPKELRGAEESSENKLRLLQMHYDPPYWQQTVEPKVAQLIETLRHYRHQLLSLEMQMKSIEEERFQEITKSIRTDIQGLAVRLEAATALLHQFTTKKMEQTQVRWLESQPLKTLNNVHLVDANLNVSQVLADYLFSKFPTIVLCSATLTTNKRFDFVRKRLGLTSQLLPQRKVQENIYESPFNYREQVLLALPIDMPAPVHPHFNHAAYEMIWQAICASQGQAFVLFTSYFMLHRCAQLLEERMRSHRYTLLKQGDDHRQILLDKFKEAKRAVLFGTDSFWEGVDVAGDALRCVIIVKLPFKVPSEPIVQARTEAILKSGADPFLDYSVPNAVVKFKQGFGRLVRNQWDRGCIICLDTRLVTKNYGEFFLNSLPKCKKAFVKSEQLWPQMKEFYRQTYHFVKKSSLS